MELFDVFKIPKNPKLKFGVPLSDVCRNGVFHIGLKDLFLKAYLSVQGDDSINYGDKTHDDKTPPVFLALKSGSNGQGSLHQRMSLKAKLEAGEWLLAVQTPAGAPLWLLRHFLGRLPQPLLEGSHWKTLAEACGGDEIFSPGELFERIYVSTNELPRAEYEVLALLTLMFQILSLHNQDRNKRIGEDILNALSEYFIASIINRPYRPGLCTKLDKKCQPLLVFLSQNWHMIFQKDSTSEIFGCMSDIKIPRTSLLEDFSSYFQNDSFDNNPKEINNNSKLRDFESLLNGTDIDQSNRSSDNDDIESEYSSEKNIFDDLNSIESDLVFTLPSVECLSSELDTRVNSENETLTSKNVTSHYKFLENDSVKNHIAKEESASVKGFASTSALLGSKAKKTWCNAPGKSHSDIDLNTKPKLFKKKFLFNPIDEDHISKLDNYKSNVKSSSTEYEYFSIPSSENSD